MKHVHVTNTTRGRELGDRVMQADWMWPRLRGLIGRPRMAHGGGLLIVPCRGVHMYLMAYPIDVALIDREGVVVALYRSLAPGTRTRWHSDAHYALEVPTGTLAATGTTIGDRLTWEPAAREKSGRPERVPHTQGRQA